jgi:hypothetical protein
MFGEIVPGVSVIHFLQIMNPAETSHKKADL